MEKIVSSLQNSLTTIKTNSSSQKGASARLAGSLARSSLTNGQPNVVPYYPLSGICRCISFISVHFYS